MKRKRFSVEQMVSVLKQAEVDVPVVEVCRQVGYRADLLPLEKTVRGVRDRPDPTAQAASGRKRQTEEAGRRVEFG